MFLPPAKILDGLISRGTQYRAMSSSAAGRDDKKKKTKHEPGGRWDEPGLARKARGD